MAKHEEESLDLPYDCFISFRGEDTRYKFLGHLREGLRRKGIKYFIDDKNMEIGASISSALSMAIEESRIFIIVLSENYASSKWCLDELVQILERSRDKKQSVYPIFYHVDPSDVRNQRDSYGKHMIEHETKFGKESQEVQAWKSALSQVGGLPGKHIKSAGSDKYEIDWIEEIVEKVNEYIAPKSLHVGQNPVGLEPRIEEVMSLLDTKADDVRMLGIYGLGGIGKTELAKALYNKIVRGFKAASFLADVREKSNKSNGLEDLQMILLSEMKEELETQLGSTSRGMDDIKRRLGQKKVLLVLDDVGDKEQLEQLAGGRDWFGKGSRIIITTRDKDVLSALDPIEEIYEMTELNEQHCLELFCFNAFKQSQPKAGFENLSLRAVGFAKRLPLALKVIGSDLALEETLDDWESVLKDYQRNGPNEKIHNVLKTSYDRLGSNPKQVFLDIACFFKGEKKEYVENILDEFSATSSIKVLCRKSLLTIEHGCLMMHDLIQDMGRHVVKKGVSSNSEEAGSRLWDYDDVIDTLTEDLGSDKIQGIMLDPPPQQKVLEWSGSAFEKMKRLRILIVRNTLLFRLTEPECLPNHLRVLDWVNYPSKSFPSKFHPKKIIVFNLPYSNLTLPERFKKFSSLTTMDLSDSKSITQMPDVSELENLRELRLDRCINLIAVHETIGILKKLAQLRVSACTKLRIFLQEMFLPSLEVLDLNLCVRLECFPKIKEEMKNPLKIYMIKTAIKELPESIGILTGLVSIDITNSTKLEYLPSSFFMLPNVVSFKSGGCSQLRKPFKSFMQSPSAINLHSKFRTLCFENGGLSDEDLSAILCCFPKLEELIASNNNFVSLPACIKECVHLTSLDMSSCLELQKIHEIECTNLRILNVHGCDNLKEISELPSTIQKVDARYCFNLTDETLHELWFQAAKEIRRLEVVMPLETVIPEWFDWVDNGGNPHFWTRGKFPNFVVALVFKNVIGKPTQYYVRQLVELDLVINGRCVSGKGDYSFRIAHDHVLICDLRLLFSDKEWLGLDAFLKHDEWNLVQVSCEVASSFTLTDWGVFVYREGTNLEDVQFTRPDPIYSDMSPTQVPTENSSNRRKRMIANLCMGKIFDMLMTLEVLSENYTYSGGESEESAFYSGLGFLRPLFKEVKDDQLECLGLAVQGKTSMETAVQTVLQLLLTTVELPGPGSFYHIKKMILDQPKKNTDEIIVKVTELMYCKPGVLYEGNMSELVAAQKHSFDEATFEWFTDSINKPENWWYHKDVGEASSSGHKESDKVQDSDPQLHKIMVMKEIFYNGVTDVLVEANKSFPSLDIVKIRSYVLKKPGTTVPIFLPHEGNMLPLGVEGILTYVTGVVCGFIEAEPSFPGLDMMKVEIVMACLGRKLEIMLIELGVHAMACIGDIFQKKFLGKVKKKQN